MLTGGGLEVAEDGGKAVEVNSGVAPAPFHVQVEAGYLLSPKSIFGVYGRFQVITLADTKRAATGAISGGLRFTRNLAPQDKPHLYVHVGGGFGHIRHTVDLAKPLQDDPDATRDTALQGMVHLGGGAGYSLPLWQHDVVPHRDQRPGWHPGRRQGRLRHQRRPEPRDWRRLLSPQSAASRRLFRSLRSVSPATFPHPLWPVACHP